MDNIVSQIIKIIKKYSKIKGFKDYFKELCKSIYPFRNILEKDNIIQIINDEIPNNLTEDNESFIFLYKTINKYTQFNMWPTHIINLSFLLSQLFKGSSKFEESFNSINDLLERLLIF
ncbi:MAG: hypothetical protein ACTSUG_16910 [Candidatus Helarchaeota archaeon]